MFLWPNSNNNTRFGLAALYCCFDLYSMPGRHKILAMSVDQGVLGPLCTAQGIEWSAFVSGGAETRQPTHYTGCHAICNEVRKKGQLEDD